MWQSLVEEFLTCSLGSLCEKSNVALTAELHRHSAIGFQSPTDTTCDLCWIANPMKSSIREYAVKLLLKREGVGIDQLEIDFWKQAASLFNHRR